MRAILYSYHILVYLCHRTGLNPGTILWRASLHSTALYRVDIWWPCEGWVEVYSELRRPLNNTALNQSIFFFLQIALKISFKQGLNLTIVQSNKFSNFYQGLLKELVGLQLFWWGRLRVSITGLNRKQRASRWMHSHQISLTPMPPFSQTSDLLFLPFF